MTAGTQHVQQLATLESESHHTGSEGNSGDTTFHLLALDMSLVAWEHTHIKNDSAVTICEENHQDAAKPGEKMGVQDKCQFINILHNLHN